MNPLPHRFVIRKTLRWVEPQDPKHFLGPVKRFAHTRLMSPTTRVSQPLRFRKVSFTASYLFFRPLAIFDIDSSSIPFYDVAVVIAQWYRSYQQPAIVPVCVAMPSFAFGRLTTCKRLAPLSQMCGNIVGVKSLLPA